MPCPSSNITSIKSQSYSVLADQIQHISIAVERLQRQLETFDDPVDSPYVQSLMDSSYEMGYEQGYSDGAEDGYGARQEE